MANGIWTLFVLANYIESKVLRIDNHDNVGKSVRFSLSALELSWCTVGSVQRWQQFLGLQSDVPQLQVTAVTAAPYCPAYSSIVCGQCTQRASTRSLGQILVHILGWNKKLPLRFRLWHFSLKKKIKINVFSFFLPNSLFDYCCHVNVCN